MDLHRLRIKSLDDDDNLSSLSYCPRNASINSDSEYSGSISVRDMIRHYDDNCNWKRDDSRTVSSHINVARKQNHTTTTLFARKTSSYSGLDFLTSSPPSQCNLLGAQPRGCIGKQKNDTSSGCCKNCTACMCCQNRNLKSSAATTGKAFQSNQITPTGNPNVDDVAVLGNFSTATTKKTNLESKDDTAAYRRPPLNARTVMQKNRLQSTDSIEEATCHPIETSHQSKTTIAKTASGVRIIIDIFFDPEQCVNASDVLGSRVETDIPQSRILNEFQQQANAGNVATAAPISAVASGSATIRN